MISVSREDAFSQFARWCDDDQHLTLALVMNGQSRRVPAKVSNFSLEQQKVLLEVMVDSAPQVWRVCFASAAFSRCDPGNAGASELIVELVPGGNRYTLKEATAVASFRQHRRANAVVAGANVTKS